MQGITERRRPRSLWLSLLLGAGLLAAGSLPTGAIAQEKITLRLGHDTIEDYQDAVARFYAEEVKRASNGRVEVQIFPANQLGSNHVMNQQVRSGALQAMVQPSAFILHSQRFWQYWIFHFSSRAKRSKRKCSILRRPMC